MPTVYRELPETLEDHGLMGNYVVVEPISFNKYTLYRFVTSSDSIERLLNRYDKTDVRFVVLNEYLALPILTKDKNMRDFLITRPAVYNSEIKKFENPVLSINADSFDTDNAGNLTFYDESMVQVGYFKANQYIYVVENAAQVTMKQVEDKQHTYNIVIWGCDVLKDRDIEIVADKVEENGAITFYRNDEIVMKIQHGNWKRYSRID